MSRFHGLTALFVATTAQLLSCTGAEPAPPAAPVTSDPVTSGAPAPGRGDAPDAAPVNAAPRALACLGEEAEITLANGLPYAKVTIGEPKFTVDFLVDYATNFSTIDLSKIPAPGPTASGCDPTLFDQSCSFATFDFFGPWGQVWLSTTQHGDHGPGVVQSGILGTDFTSRVAVTLDWTRSKVSKAGAQELCSEADLAGAGFSPLSAAGFFTSDPSKLRPLADVIEGASPSRTVANVPTVPLRIAGVLTHAQLDTGFADVLVPHSINVNEAFLGEVIAKDPTALVRAADRDLSLSTCVGISEPVEAYTLRAGAAAELVSESGQAARTFASATIFVKRTPPAARTCGGIGTWTVPAAQIGASFFVDLGLVVFDPFASRVWVK